MAKRNTTGSVPKPGERPKTINDHIFFGLTLDEEQMKFANCILDESIRCVR